MSVLTNNWENLRTWWQSATPSTRAAATALAALLVIALIAAVMLAANPDYVPIYRGVSGKDAAAIEGVLKDKGILMRYSDADQTVSVPSKDESNAVMYVEAAGVLSKDATTTQPGPLGLPTWTDSPDISDAKMLGVREGEISQMLMQLDPVQNADVKLSLGDDSSLFDNATPASASVLLTLRPGDALDADQAKGIASLVADAVPGLDAKNVTLTDQTGATLWPTGSTGDGDQNNASDRFAAREQAKLQSLLDSTIGPGKSRVTVSAQLDFDQIKKEIVQHVPTVPGGSSSLPLSETDKKETYTGAGAPGGAGGPAGTASNIPSYTASSSTSSSGAYKSEDSVINYVDNVDTTEIIAAPGSLKQLLVGVMIDSSVPPSTAMAFQKEISTLAGVSTSDPSRQVLVQQIPFDTSAQKIATAAAKSAQTQALMSNLIKAAVALAVVGALLFLATRGSSRRVAMAPQLALAGEGANIGLLDQPHVLDTLDSAVLEERPLRIEDVLAEMPEVMPGRSRRRPHAPAIEEQPDLKLESVQEMIAGSPQSVALLLKGWMAEDAVRAA